jgi:hypothetical protein
MRVKDGIQGEAVPTDARSASVSKAIGCRCGGRTVGYDIATEHGWCSQSEAVNA